MATSSNNRTKIFVFYWLPVIFYCLVIYIQSSHPVTESLPPFPHADKLVHTAGYALLGFLFYRAYLATGMSRRARILLIVSALSASAYGVSDEIHQYFVPSRTAEFADIVADSVGSVMGAMVALIFFHRR